MKKKTLAWAVKYSDGSYLINSQWTKKDADENADTNWGHKVFRVEIKEVKKK